MKVVDFIKAKNDIIHKHTGIWLVPYYKIIEVPKEKLDYKSNDGAMCPYCKTFNYYQRWKSDTPTLEQCEGCPLLVVDNGCPTWTKVVDTLGHHIHNDESIMEDLRPLIDLYNSELDKED